MRRGSEGQASSGQDLTSSRIPFLPLLDVPEELQSFPPSDDIIVNLVNVYFHLLQDSYFSFLHEGQFTTQFQDKSIPESVLYSVCATSAR